MEIRSVFDPAFKPYGRVVEGYPVDGLLAALKTTPLPDAVAYTPREEALHAAADAQAVGEALFGGMPFQLGWCNGHNTRLNCLEYHRDSEFNLGTEAFILLLAKQDEMENGVLDTAKVRAFRVPAGAPAGFLMAAAHTDSPTFKIKHNPEKKAGPYVQLSTEKYGGMLMGTWFDRPLSVAGRVVTAKDGKLETKLVDVDRDLLVIPSVAIHMNRAANDGFKLMANVDTLPLYGMQEASGSFRGVVAAAAGVKEDEILGEDLSLYVRTRGTVFGAKDEFVLAPRLDDLGCVFGLLEGFLAAAPSGSVPVFCAFDNEEVGSETKQGAASSLLSDTLRRIALALGLGEEGYLRLLAQSFLVSADNAHAVHPNHPEYADMTNTPRMNGGVVIKFNANQRYTTDGVSCALFTAICREAKAPVQVYANRSDLPGGSTLGSIATTKVSVPSVDIGLAQLAMHSCVETAGAADLDALVRVMTLYYGKTLRRAGETLTF